MGHLNYIGIENFRVFSERELFDFAPITILTGTNSAGKSSLMNGLSILQRYFSNVNFTASSGDRNLDALCYLKVEDIEERLGDFSKLVNRNSTSSSFSFSLPTALKGVIDALELRVELEAIPNDKLNGMLKSISIWSRCQNKNILDVTVNNSSTKVLIDYLYFWNEFKRESQQCMTYWEIQDQINETKNSVIQIELERAQRNSHPYLFDYRENEPFLRSDEYLELKGLYYLPYFNNRPDRTYYDSDIFLYCYDEDILEKHFEGVADYRSIINKLEDDFLSNFEFSFENIDNEEYPLLLNIFQDIAVPTGVIHSSGLSKRQELLNNPIVELIEKSFADVEVAPSLSNFQRFFKPFVEENIISAFDIATKSIRNMPFLPSIRNVVSRTHTVRGKVSPFNTIINEFQSKAVHDKQIKAFVDKYLHHFGIAHSIEVKNFEGVYNAVYLKENDSEILLADLGYGISQLLPIILQIANNAKKSQFQYKFYSPSIIAIEEPETNLHPALQSKLADLFFAAYTTFNIQFIIETHSEYLIRKFQYLTASSKNSLSPDHSVIYYFKNPKCLDQDEKQITQIKIRKDGMMTNDFGEGFFDETAHWTIELLKLQHLN